MADVPSLRALLIEELRDHYDAERQLLETLPELAKAATEPDLRAAFKKHLHQTRHHPARLAEAMKLLGAPVHGKPCHAMFGLVAECTEVRAMIAPSAVRDAALIDAAQRIEHCEIAGYGTARAFAHALGEHQVAELLHMTLDEEGDANHALNGLARLINADALAARDEAPPSAEKAAG